MKKVQAFGLAVFVGFIAFLATGAEARPARCQITSTGEKYRGKCDFMPEAGNGGFDISPIGRQYFFSGIGPIGVYKTAKDRAEVRGLTKEGINSRWGEAVRSKSDPACWVGSDFKICVY